MSRKRIRVHWYQGLCTNCARLHCRHVCYGGERVREKSESGNISYITYTHNCDSLQMTKYGYLGCICCEQINRPKPGTKCRYYKLKTMGENND